MRSIEWWHCPWPWVPPNRPKLPHFLYFAPPIHSFVTGEPRDFKLGTLTDHSKSHPADKKIYPERGVVGVSWPVLEFYTLRKISATANARDFKFCTRVAIQSLSLLMSECSQSGRGRGHVSNFYIVNFKNFASANRRYTGDIHNSTVVGLFMTPIRPVSYTHLTLPTIYSV